MKRFTTILLLSAAINACNNGSGPTSGFNPSHVATLVGTAQGSAGVPLDSVRITAAPLTGRPGDFGTAAIMTGAGGTYELPFERFSARVNSSQVDTVRVLVTAQALKHSYLDESGNPPTQKDTVLLTLKPYGQAPVSSTVSFSFSQP